MIANEWFVAIACLVAGSATIWTSRNDGIYALILASLLGLPFIVMGVGMIAELMQ